MIEKMLSPYSLFAKLSLLVFAAFFFLSCSEESQHPQHKLFGQENAIWTESIYLRGYKPSTKERLQQTHLENFAKTLKRNKVKYAYMFAGPYQKDGRLPAYPFSDLAKNSIKTIKRLYPEIIILPWIGGVQNSTVYLGDSLWVQNALADTEKLIKTLGVPGVHIDFEFYVKGDPYLDTRISAEKPLDMEYYGNNVNSFHKNLREILPEAFISSVVVATSPDTKPWKRKTSMEELRTLVKYVDQLSFLFYDTQINRQEVFRENCEYLMDDIQQLKALGTNTQFLVAIGTFVNRKELQKYRDLEIENIPNSLNVIKESTLAVNDKERILDGIAIYCDWETDEQEWKDFYTNYVTAK